MFWPKKSDKDFKAFFQSFSVVFLTNKLNVLHAVIFVLYKKWSGIFQLT